MNEALRKDPNAPHYICAHPFNPERVGIVNRWNILTDKRKQKDEYGLEGIKFWRINSFELLPGWDIDEAGNRATAIEEGVTLLKEGFTLGYNTESGVGTLLTRADGYVISAWTYGSNHIDDEILTAREAVEWLIERSAGG